MPAKSSIFSRRSFLKTSTAAAAVGGFAQNTDVGAVSDRVNTNSQPSELKITDLRVARLKMDYIIRIDTNQGISGYGELKAGASKVYALMLKRVILGMNPCNVDKIFRKIKQFGFHARQGAGVFAVEMALWDLAGKAWGVPIWQMLGGKFRDKILMYSEANPFSEDPVVMGNRMKQIMEKGYKFLKMDIGIRLLDGIEGTITEPPGMSKTLTIKHPFTGIRVTDKGLKVMQEYCATVRDIVGWEIPIATDHFGHMGIEDCIKIAQALDQFNFAWYEDMIPWEYTDQYVRLSQSCTTPILTGEDIYLKEGFMPLIEKKAVAIVHPDLGSSGGILETKKLGDAAMEHGISMAIHGCNYHLRMYASIHCAAATENFLAQEFTHPDEPWYDEMIEGVPKPLVQDGYIPVPDGPGLGIELVEDAVKEQMPNPKEYFLPTPEWDKEDIRINDRLWSMIKADEITLC
ncbi:enolase C-terminal domain-like protein [Candidatus Latescibacterota bacterium]